MALYIIYILLFFFGKYSSKFVPELKTEMNNQNIIPSIIIAIVIITSAEGML